jgi:hypothetical protein
MRLRDRLAVFAHSLDMQLDRIPDISLDLVDSSTGF